MGCGCNKKSSLPRRPSFRPSVGPKAITGGLAAGANNPVQLRALGLQKATSITDVRKMDEQRRRIEKLRREAIKKKLNK